eukprot:TRINITY_DN442_c0_g1_i1.p1 TRINITY_DN442_c0_g1~~TRINITY_DN442_c0_g1_i1.p1  ORF type:complete len:137 (+),score=41.45 TRINITY_DN442_c0_g1_i1:35-445(+)
MSTKCAIIAAAVGLGTVIVGGLACWFAHPKKPCPKTILHVLASIKLKKESDLEEYKKLIQPLIEHTKKEKGNFKYVLVQDKSDPLTCTFIEEWASEEALKEHCASEAFTSCMDKTKPLLVDAAQVKMWKTVEYAKM